MIVCYYTTKRSRSLINGDAVSLAEQHHDDLALIDDLILLQLQEHLSLHVLHLQAALHPTYHHLLLFVQAHLLEVLDLAAAPHLAQLYAVCQLLHVHLERHVAEDQPFAALGGVGAVGDGAVDAQAFLVAEDVLAALAGESLHNADLVVVLLTPFRLPLLRPRPLLLEHLDLLGLA